MVRTELGWCKNTPRLNCFYILVLLLLLLLLPPISFQCILLVSISYMMMRACIQQEHLWSWSFANPYFNFIGIFLRMKSDLFLNSGKIRIDFNQIPSNRLWDISDLISIRDRPIQLEQTEGKKCGRASWPRTSQENALTYRRCWSDPSIASRIYASIF